MYRYISKYILLVKKRLLKRIEVGMMPTSQGKQ